MISATAAKVKKVTIISVVSLLGTFATGGEAIGSTLSGNYGDTRPNQVTVGDPSNYEVAPGEYEGVADLILESISGSLNRCTGALLPTGAHILTAAHCVTDDTGNLDVFGGTANFDLFLGDISLSVDNIFVHDDWFGELDDDGTVDYYAGNDIAILELEAIAPEEADRYGIYRQTDEVGQVGDKVGYGRSGTGDTGDNISSGTKRAGQNLYDATGDLFGSDWSESLLGYDFDNGETEKDAFGFFFGDAYADLGLGLNEVNSAPGDSGGPTFINGSIAGITSFSYRRTRGGATSDIDNVVNSSYGEFSFDTRVSSYSGWIDDILTAWNGGDVVGDDPGDGVGSDPGDVVGGDPGDGVGDDPGDGVGSDPGDVVGGDPGDVVGGDPGGEGPVSVPEPSTLAGLMVLGAGILLTRKKHRSA